MILELDAGNTRIKWRLVDEVDGELKHIADDSVFAIEKVPSVFIELGQQLDKLPLGEIHKMRVANVRGKAFREAFSALMTEKWHLQPEFASVRSPCAGVTSAYDDVESMGVDRWLAMLAGYRQAGTACCIVDCGSTITIDVVDAGGRHVGGYIVPGLHLMRNCLSARSRALKLEGDPLWESVSPGISTRQAIEHGIVVTALGLLEKIHDQGLGRYRWMLTGGDAQVLAPLLEWPHEVKPELVMDGLALAMD